MKHISIVRERVVADEVLLLSKWFKNREIKGEDNVRVGKEVGECKTRDDGIILCWKSFMK